MFSFSFKHLEFKEIRIAQIMERFTSGLGIAEISIEY